jgi:tRNA A37 methylthiotransferase MiaB
VVTKRNKLMLWKIEEVLVVGQKKGYFYGRTKNFKEIFFKWKDIKIWDLVNVKITKLDKYVLKWEFV